MTGRQEADHGKRPSRPRTNSRSTGSDGRNAVIVEDAIGWCDPKRSLGGSGADSEGDAQRST